MTGYDKLISFLSTIGTEKPMQEGLEEEMDRFFETMPVLEHENIFEDTFKNIARHFAQWQRQKMLKEAVEGTIVDAGFDDHTALVSIPDKRDDEGDKVRVIVIPKEDEK